MCLLVPAQTRLLSQIGVAPTSHHDLPHRDRHFLGALWAHRFVALRPGDVWMITPRGKAMLDSAGAMH